MPKSDYQLTSRASKATEREDEADLLASSDEPLKFSVRRDLEQEGGNSRRIIIFIVIVLALGLGLTFLVQSFVSQGNGNGQTSSSTSTSEEAIEIAGVTINDVEKEDSESIRQISDSQYTDVELNLGSPANVNAELKLEKIDYTPYKSFSELRLTLSEVATGLPSTKISYDNKTDKVVVTMDTVSPLDISMLQEIRVDTGNVTQIFPQQVEGDMEITVSFFENVKFYAAVEGKNVLVIYFKSDSQFSVSSTTTASETTSSAASSTSSSVSTTTVSSTSSSAASGTDQFDNAVSQNKQTVTNTKVTDNSLISETYYYEDKGTSFEFSWAIRGANPAVPNATAEYVAADGKNYIEVKISNLSYDLLHALGRQKAIINISTASSNMVDVYTKGFTGGTATFWVEVKAKKDFRLHSTNTVNSYRLLSIELMD